MTYDPNPSYPVTDGEVEVGYRPWRRRSHGGRPNPRDRRTSGLSWDRFAAGFVEELERRGIAAELVDARRFLAPWDEIERRTATSVLAAIRCSAASSKATSWSFDELPRAESMAVSSSYSAREALRPSTISSGTRMFPSGSVSAQFAAARPATSARGGRRPGASSSFFVDWPILDRHKQRLLPRLDRYVDLSEPESPRSLVGESLRRTLADLARRPFRTRPTFLPGPWGGQWLRDRLGISTEAPNLAWSYELITPESGIVLGADETIEVGFELLMAAEGSGFSDQSLLSGSVSRSRSGSTTWTRSEEGISRSSAIRPRRTCRRRSDFRTRSTRRTTSWTRSPARKSSSACAKTPISRPSG